jgi:hypothetical protein
MLTTPFNTKHITYFCHTQLFISVRHTCESLSEVVALHIQHTLHLCCPCCADTITTSCSSMPYFSINVVVLAVAVVALA